MCDVEDYPDDFIDKFVEVVRINSKLNYKTPNVNVHILFLSTWDSLKDKLDAEIYENVRERFERQLVNAREWGDQVNSYFFRKSGIPDEKGREIW